MLRIFAIIALLTAGLVTLAAWIDPGERDADVSMLDDAHFVPVAQAGPSVSRTSADLPHE